MTFHIKCMHFEYYGVRAVMMKHFKTNEGYRIEGQFDQKNIVRCDQGHFYMMVLIEYSLNFEN